MTLLAISKTAGFLMAGAGLFIVVVASILVAQRRGFRKKKEAEAADIPPAMRPGPSDPDLEKPLLEKLQGWGIVLVAFSAVWMAIYWIQEPSANLAREKAMSQESIERGELAVQFFSEENPSGIACVRCHGPELRGQEIEFEGEPYPAPPLVTVCQRLTLDEVRNTIMQGRPGTPMPSWSVRFQGALNDQQIADIINYLLSIQEVPFDQNKCINPEAASPSPSAESSPEASP
ncbi:MAG: cytochrome c [Actinomycetota bacterium]